MKFKTLQENLCQALKKEMGNGGLTGTALAARTGLKQAHISNFLNGKRGLSLEAMDRVLTAQNLSVLDLVDRDEINEHASVPESEEPEFHNVPVVDGCKAAAAPRIERRTVRELLKFPTSFLEQLRTSHQPERVPWDRFVALQVDARMGMSMFPRLMPGATVLIDRHYHLLKPYRRGEYNMYLVRRRDRSCLIRYIEAVDQSYILRPHNPAYAIEMITPARHHSIFDYIIGRVAHVGMDT